MSAATKSLLPPPATSWNEGRVVFWAMIICNITFLLNSLCILRPMLFIDDFQILLASWTWQDTRANLWLPQNEHSMPLGRISTFVLAHLAGKQTLVPLVLQLQGPLAIVAATFLLYLLVRRETGRPFLGLLAMLLFGINTHYQEAVYWFAASFAVLGLDTMLLALLAAQRWRQTGRVGYLALSGLWCVLAPGWFGSGVLAGPLCAVYLFFSLPPAAKGAEPFSWWPLTGPNLRAGARRVLLPALVPLLGTVISLAISLPFNGEKIANLPRVGMDVPAWKTFQPFVALEYTLRAMVDDLIPGAIGIGKITSSLWVVRAVWVIFLVVGFLWWRLAPHRALLWLGLGMIVLSYEAAFTIRAYMDYDDIHSSSRYQLFPHSDLVLIVCGGLSRALLKGIITIPPRLVDLALVGLVGVLLATQCPRSAAVADDPPESARQYTDLQRIEKMDALCEEHHIDAATARQALQTFEVFGMNHRVLNGHRLSGWDLLRGSRSPKPMTVDEARELLKEE